MVIVGNASGFTSTHPHTTEHTKLSHICVFTHKHKTLQTHVKASTWSWWCFEWYFRWQGRTQIFVAFGAMRLNVAPCCEFWWCFVINITSRRLATRHANRWYYDDGRPDGRYTHFDILALVSCVRDACVHVVFVWRACEEYVRDVIMQLHIQRAFVWHWKPHAPFTHIIYTLIQ